MQLLSLVGIIEWYWQSDCLDSIVDCKSIQPSCCDRGDQCSTNAVYCSTSIWVWVGVEASWQLIPPPSLFQVPNRYANLKAYRCNPASSNKNDLHTTVGCIEISKITQQSLELPQPHSHGAFYHWALPAPERGMQVPIDGMEPSSCCTQIALLPVCRGGTWDTRLPESPTGCQLTFAFQSVDPSRFQHWHLERWRGRRPLWSVLLSGGHTTGHDKSNCYWRVCLSSAKPLWQMHGTASWSSLKPHKTGYTMMSPPMPACPCLPAHDCSPSTHKQQICCRKPQTWKCDGTWKLVQGSAC